jgi:uncharacterized phage-like protein YoqJ
MIVGITGHRPTLLGGYKIPNTTFNFLVSETEKFLIETKADKIITGMCIGYDQWVAELAIKLKIPFIAAVPFIGQELLWPKESQQRYRTLIDHADQVEIVNPGGFASWKMQARNRWIVDHCDLLLAAFDGSSKGGTFNCVEYAKESSKNIKLINPKEASK